MRSAMRDDLVSTKRDKRDENPGAAPRTNPLADDLPSFIDFEASSLGSSSYPIEVAWNLPDGTVESHLISPEGVALWTDWSPQAEEVHGITRARLRAEGRSPAWVCRRMNGQLAGRTVHSDEPDFDGMWLAALFSAARRDPPAFRLDGLDELLLGRISPSPTSRAEGLARLRALKEEARRRVSRRHRAGWDVRYLIELWRLAAAGGVALGKANERRNEVDGQTIELYNKVPRPSWEGEGA